MNNDVLLEELKKIGNRLTTCRSITFFHELGHLEVAMHYEGKFLYLIFNGKLYFVGNDGKLTSKPNFSNVRGANGQVMFYFDEGKFPNKEQLIEILRAGYEKAKYSDKCRCNNKTFYTVKDKFGAYFMSLLGCDKTNDFSLIKEIETDEKNAEQLCSEMFSVKEYIYGEKSEVNVKYLNLSKDVLKKIKKTINKDLGM